MLCTISNEPPEEPVISRSSGHLFEKRLVEKYIQQNGTHPVTQETITTDDLLPLQSARVVQPRAPSQTSLPALLKSFQNEWDALALELYNVKLKLKTTQKELSTALYQNDASVRVIATLRRERDEARHALSNLSVSAPPAGHSTSGGGGGGDAMDVDNGVLSAGLAETVNRTKAELSKGRKKRTVAAGTAPVEAVAAFTPQHQLQLPLEQVAALDMAQDCVAVGGPSSNSIVLYSKAKKEVGLTLDVGAPVSAILVVDKQETMDAMHLIACTTEGTMTYFNTVEKIGTFKEHAGPITGVAIHPSGKIVATVGADTSMTFVDITGDLRSVRSLTDAALTACAFHPDGHLFAAGSEPGDIKLYDTISRQHMATFTIGAPIQAIVFSENGYHLAVAGKGLSTVTVFDLRKDGDAARAKVFEHDSPVDCIAWDFSSQYLAIGGSSGVSVQQWVKSSKSWNEILKTAVPAAALEWTKTARELIVSSREGLLTVLSHEE